MPPKRKGKGGRRGDSDEEWAGREISDVVSTALTKKLDLGSVTHKTGTRFSALAMTSSEEDSTDSSDTEESDPDIIVETKSLPKSKPSSAKSQFNAKKTLYPAHSDANDLEKVAEDASMSPIPVERNKAATKAAAKSQSAPKTSGTQKQKINRQMYDDEVKGIDEEAPLGGRKGKLSGKVAAAKTPKNSHADTRKISNKKGAIQSDDEGYQSNLEKSSDDTFSKAVVSTKGKKRSAKLSKSVSKSNVSVRSPEASRNKKEDIDYSSDQDEALPHNMPDKATGKNLDHKGQAKNKSKAKSWESVINESGEDSLDVKGQSRANKGPSQEELKKFDNQSRNKQQKFKGKQPMKDLAGIDEEASPYSRQLSVEEEKAISTKERLKNKKNSKASAEYENKNSHMDMGNRSQEAQNHKSMKNTSIGKGTKGSKGVKETAKEDRDRSQSQNIPSSEEEKAENLTTKEKMTDIDHKRAKGMVKVKSRKKGRSESSEAESEVSVHGKPDKKEKRTSGEKGISNVKDTSTAKRKGGAPKAAAREVQVLTEKSSSDGENAAERSENLKRRKDGKRNLSSKKLEPETARKGDARRRDHRGRAASDSESESQRESGMMETTQKSITSRKIDSLVEGQKVRPPLATSKRRKEKVEAVMQESSTAPQELADEENGQAASEDLDWEAMGDQLSEEEQSKKVPQKESLPQSTAEGLAKQDKYKDEVKVADKNKKKSTKEIPANVQLRSPILCIMGHVDTGKTKLLDKIRHTNVQDREAGGITQQIGATFFPRENLVTQCSKIEEDLELRVPGLLIIDTPGHASFSNLRKRGSSLCDIAILVVDIMHGLEPQTRESITLLRQRKCPFVIALNKIDRLYGWIGCEWQPCRESLNEQEPHVREEFDTRVQKVLLELTAEEGLNCEIYWDNLNVRKNVSVVPTSAITGEGLADLLFLIVKLTQQLMIRQIVLDTQNIVCTVLEVKTIEGLGTTIDVILVSGVLREGDTIVVCGLGGPIVTTIRALLTPHPMKELRIKGEYIHHTSLSAAMGVKIAGHGLEDSVAGTAMMVARNPNNEAEIEQLKDDVQEDMGAIFKSVDKSQEGVYVMASTLGSLEALLDFLKESKIPVCGINIGTVWKLDVKKASTMRERGREEFSLILAFDVKIDPEADKEAKALGVKIFSAEIIYHLFDAFTEHMNDFKEAKRKEASVDMVFPCLLSVIPHFIFNRKDPLVLGVRVDDGEARIGTPLVVIDKEHSVLRIGKISSIELNKKPVTSASKGQEVCIKITGDASITFGRHFDEKQKLVAQISRRSIDLMKLYNKEDLTKHLPLVLTLKKKLGIP